MFFNIFNFELKYRFSRPATYIYFALLFLVSFVLVGVGNTPATEKVFHNAPITLAFLQLTMSLFGIFLASAVMGVPIYRDLEHKTGTFLFSYPISKTAYFMGRFWGSFFILVFISFGSIIGSYLGSIIGPALGWEEASRYGPNLLMNYLYPWLTLTLPNLWLAGTLFFAVIVFTKNIKAIYAGGIIVFIIYMLSSIFSEDVASSSIAQILDPFGLNTFDIQTRYLTPYEQNNFLLQVEGNLLLNRLLWFGVGAVLFVSAYARFNFENFFSPKVAKTKKEKETTKISSIKRLVANVSFTNKYQWSSFKTLAKIEVQNVLKDVYFKVILLGGVIFLFVDLWFGFPLYGVSSLPVTSDIVANRGFTYGIFVFIIIVFFTGESLHRDKASGYASINDTFPVKDSAIVASKFAGMAFICVLLTLVPVFAGLVTQTLNGYFNYHLDVYLIDAFLIALPDYLQMVMLVFAIHLLVNNKFAGHATSVVVWLAMLILRNFAGYDFNMFFFSYKPGFSWSEMNGLGHFGESLFWFNSYWTAFGIFLVLFFSIFFSRGTDDGFKSRLRVARGRLTSANAKVSYLFLIITIALGGYIFKSVVYDNNYLTSDEATLSSVSYEKQLKQYEHLPQPKLTSVNMKADLFPYDREAHFNAEVTLVNKTDSNIDSLHLDIGQLSDLVVMFGKDTLQYRTPMKLAPRKFQVFGKKPRLGNYRIMALPKTMAPGDTLNLVMNSKRIFKGFPNAGSGRDIVYNGTFTSETLPTIGYNPQVELTSDSERKKYDLPAKDYDLPAHDDELGRRTLLFTDDADFIQFEATISTVPDQIAIAPGYLQREWVENGRRYFHYIQDTPIQAFFNIVSAKYDVLKSEQELPNGEKVNIEIFYHSDHDYNLDRFEAAYKDGLKYFSETYGSFQFRQMRLLEFPKYASFAQSFPNTVPFSEGFGWLADFDDPDDFDYTYFVTAHELAHQWWGHQIAPNYTRGANLVSEALAEYSALVLTERQYGKDNMTYFLRNELDDYLFGRANESKKENTFINCNRAYQWYNKGSLILYGLRDYIGEEAMNTALRSFADEFALKQTPPFAGSTDLYRHLAENTPDSLQYYLEDTWNKITLYENKANQVKAEKIAEDEYLVTFDINSQKLYADSAGMESKAEYLGDFIDIGVFSEDDKDENGRTRTNSIYLQKHKISPGQTSLTVRVKGVPVRAGIDPYNKLIDRMPDDNVVDVEVESSSNKE
ncbi:ABC transporter permease/M1 family aminopeptidase [Roseivirga sp.]|uniref:ABC transporter permease/M1 family aminopeptidase n=1 Tax=Roseivirga sp. TaxID=1964215 RepID=UPI002B2663D3|nr:M1 family aminopeptidase [Roseivirga sp.]